MTNDRSNLPKRLQRLFDKVIVEAKENPSFAVLLEQHFCIKKDNRRTHTKRRHRRTKGVLDPITVYEQGEEVLRKQLEDLDIEQLKDIVAEHGMDTQKLAMKWKKIERLIDLIVSTTRSRIEKGSAFRREEKAS